MRNELIDHTNSGTLDAYGFALEKSRTLIGSGYSEFENSSWAFASIVHAQVLNLLRDFGMDPSKIKRGRPREGAKTMREICEGLRDPNGRWSAKTIGMIFRIFEGYKNRQQLLTGNDDQLAYSHPFWIASDIELAKLGEETKGMVYKEYEEKKYTKEELRKRIRELREPSDSFEHKQEYGNYWDFKAYDDRLGMPGVPGRIQGQVMTNLIHLYTEENDLIFFPFFGSGTGGDAARMLNRRYCGIDLFIPEEVKNRHGEALRKHNALEKWPIDNEFAKMVIAHPPRWISKSGLSRENLPSLRNMDFDDYVGAIEIIASEANRVLPMDGKFAIILEQVNIDEDGVPYEDLPLLCHEKAISPHFELVRRCVVPMSPTPYNADDIQNALFNRRTLNTFRDIFIYAKR